MKIAFREVAFGGLDYRELVNLRYRVLRVPLGLEWSEEDLAEDVTDRHFGLWEGEQGVGCALLRDVGDGKVKLRQMAIKDGYQGRGLGAELIKKVAEVAVNDGAEKLELHAREAVAKFYTHLGFEPTGDSFTEVGIPHRKMTRNLRET